MQDVCTPVEPEVIMRLEFDETSCPSAQRYDLWEVAAVRETALYSDDGSGMCVARPEPPSEVYVAGAPVDVATLPLIDHLEVGTGPLRARFQGFDGVPYVPVWRWPEPFVDSASGQPCKPLEFEDGALRCVPDSVPTASEGGFYYESASCSGTRVALWTPDVDCFPDPPAPLTAVVVATDEVCSTGTIVDTPAVTGRSNATTLYWINPMTGACEGFDWSGNPDRVAYILGESLDPADLFAEVELVLRE
jgi:hypothetical protein